MSQIKVRMLQAMAGVTFSHVAGDEIEIPAENAPAWFAAGLAEPIEGAAVVEEAVATPKTEKAVARPTKAK